MLPLDEYDDVEQGDGQLLRNIIATVLKLAISSWSNILARGEIGELDTENNIAGCLGKEMIAVKNREFGRHAQFYIDEESGTRSVDNPDKPDGRIDIKIIYSFVESEYFGIECKRVSDKGNDLAKKYVNKGLLRFVAGKYSPGHDWMAMIGFVIDGRASQCIQRITEYLAITRRRTRLKEDWIPETNFGTHENLYRTRHHQRGKDSPITVLHLFLNIKSSLTPLTKPIDEY